MKKYAVLDILYDIVPKDFAIIVVGNDLHTRCKRKGVLFLDDSDFNLSFALGVALASNKKIFVICEDWYAIRNLSELMQMSVSGCKNLFLCLLSSGVYSIGSPTIFKSINSVYGFFHGLGFFTFDYTKYFDKGDMKSVELGINRNRGPLVILIDVLADKRKTNSVNKSKEDAINFLEFLKMEE